MQSSAPLWAACGATNLTWDGSSSTTWATAANWTPANIPDASTENAIIVSATRTPALASSTVSCLEVQSGVLNATANGTTLTVTGDYFKAVNSGSLTFTNNRTITIDMAGTGAQTLEVVDNINYVTISNSSTVTFSRPFTLRNTLSITGSGTTLNIQGDLNLSATGTVFTIPSGVTVNVGSGVTLTAAGGLTVNGTLTVAGGAKVLIGSGRTLTVAAGGALQLNGTSGNPATLDSAAGTYTFTMAGTLSANYFAINHMVAAGINVTGTISQMQNGDFHYVATSGNAMTIGVGATLPANMPSIGFYDDSSFNNNRNFNVNASYTGGAVYLDQYSGDLGGAALERADSNGKINWGSQASTKLTVADNTASGSPPATIAASSAATLFGTYAFNLSQADLATDVMQIKFTMYGTANASDISYIRVYKDAASSQNCAYNAGTDTQVGSDLTLSGSPPSVIANFSTGDINTSGATQACVHVLVATSATAQPGDTIGLSIESTADVSNSRSGGGSYSFGVTSSPPVRPGVSTISGTTFSTWDGSSNSTWTTTANWTPATLPSSTRDCRIGSAVNIPALTANQACENVTLQTGGTLNFSSGSWQLQAYGALEIQSGFTFQNASSGTLALVGSTAQSIVGGGATFPGNLLVNNTGGANVNVAGDLTVTGTLTVTAGNLHVSAGKTLTVGGNITVQTGATLTVDPGGTLTMSNGRTLTVNSGGTLALLGSSSNTALVTLASGASGYSIAINGTLKAQYYTIDHMGLAGLTINSGATIDTTYHLQNGSFTYPVVNSAVMLTLNRKVPGDALTDMVFDANGSAATGVTNIKTNATAGTLSVTTYSGGLSGPSYENAPTYLLSWTGATNTINVTQEATGPGSANQGTTYVMGRYGFQQTQAGASFSDATITQVVLTLTGTGSASDVSAVRLYYDAACAGSGGTQLGSAATFTGNPATVTFSGISAAVQAHTTSPPKRCIYVEYDIASNAVNGNTVGVKLNANSDITNSQSYSVAAGTPLPITLGSPASIVGSSTTWIGTTSNNFCTAANWNGGLPSASLNCVINNAANNPVINGTSCTLGTCKSVTINSGSLSVSSGGTLAIHGSLTNAATFTNSGTLQLNDGGVAVNQTITGVSVLGTVTFAKTAGGTARAAGTATIGTLTIPAGSVFEWTVQSGDTLTLTNGLSLTPAGATFNVQGGGVLRIPNGQGISVAGGTFKVSGTNDAYPQATSNKGKITNNGSGRYSFTATSGTVNLTGWWIDSIDANGLVIGGTTTLSSLSGGQFTNLSTAFPIKAIQINTSGSIPATASNVGWNWGTSANGTYNSPPSPLTTDNYQLASSTGCGNQAISFDQWFGDFFVGVGSPDTSTKISATSCSISIAASASPVTLLSLVATPYDSAISLDWETGSEFDHQGFNVYRSLDPASGYIQVNPELIRNTYSSASLHGLYRYVDAEAVNGLQYYYRIEDVAINGSRTLHGPVWAVADASHGTAPGSPAGTNAGGSSSGGDSGNALGSGSIANPDAIDLGNGVHILAQTKGSLRLEIVPPPISYSASAWNASYQRIGLPGYAATTEAGKPELVERMILVEVDPSRVTATVTHAAVDEAAPSSHLIAPAPSYALGGGGVLTPSYSPDAAAYVLNADTPSAFYSVDPTLQRIGGKTFVAVKATPVLFNAASQQVRLAEKIVLDIGLDGGAWSAPQPSVSIARSPSAVEGALRIRYARSGMYELSYADIAAAGLEGFVSGAPVAGLRLYVRGTETPLSVHAAGAAFSLGDKLRFFLPFDPSADDTENEAVLSTTALMGSLDAPLRMQPIDGDPTGAPLSDELGSFARATAEQDLFYIMDVPLGIDGLDHFYWARITQDQGVATQGSATFSATIELPNLRRDAADPVVVRVSGRGRGAMAANPIHHLALLVNNVPFALADKTVATQYPTTVDFAVPAGYFAPGTNSLKVRVLGDLLQAGDTDIFDIDRIEVNYRADRYAVDDALEFHSQRPYAAVSIDGFTGDVFKIYDVTDPDDVRIVANAQHFDDGSSYGATFAANPGAEEDLGYRYIAVKDGSYLKPTALRLGRGAQIALKSSSPGADLLVVGPRGLLEAADELVAQRQSEGLRVVLAPLDQVYAEFSDGIRSAHAIRGLVEHAMANWVAPAPRYLLILGDATYDPRNRLGYGNFPDVMPVYVESGIYGDFAGDNWYVARGDGTDLPQLAVGRVPASQPSQVAEFVAKLLAYERGERSPEAGEATRIALVSDSDTNSEGFSTMTDAIATTLQHVKNGGSTTKIDRAQLGSDAATRSAIQSAFASGPFGMAYVGHGAEDMWAGAGVFTAAEASALSNTRLPLVMAFNCLNSYFYDADPSYRGLGEALLLNPHGGAIAFWGSTTLTTPAVQYKLAVGFFDEYAQETNLAPHVARFGDLVLRAKAALGSSAATRDALRSYTFFGDPSTKLPLNAFTGTIPSTSGSEAGSGGSTPAPAPAVGGGGEEDSGGGFLSCGSIRAQGGNGRGGPGGSAAAAAEFGLLVALLLLIRAGFARNAKLEGTALLQG